MSREDVERTRVDWAKAPKARTAEQALFLRFPWLLPVLYRLVLSRPPGSQLRRATVPRGILAGFAAYNRKDFDAVLVNYRPDAVIRVVHSAVPGVEGEYHGHEGLRRFWSLWMDAWSDWRLVPVEILDFPEKTLVLLWVEARGAGSGVEMKESQAILFGYKDGAVASHTEWREWQSALEAVGVSE